MPTEADEEAVLERLRQRSALHERKAKENLLKVWVKLNQEEKEFLRTRLDAKYLRFLDSLQLP